MQQGNVSDTSEVAKRGNEFIEVLTQGVQNFMQIKKQLAHPLVKVQEFRRVGKGVYQPINISISIENPQTYTIVYRVRGIESAVKPTTLFTIKASVTTKAIATGFVTFIVFSMYILATMASGSEWSAWWGVPIFFEAIAGVVVFFVVHHHPNTLDYLNFTLEILLGLTVFTVIYTSLKQKKDKKKDEEFYKQKHDIFYEYAFQKMFHNVSKIWEGREKNTIPTHDVDTA